LPVFEKRRRCSSNLARGTSAGIMAEPDLMRELLVRHFARLNRPLPTCPICENKEWGAEALALPHLFQDDGTGGMVPTGLSMAIIPMVCTRCGFVYEMSYGVLRRLDKGE
jgi:hypothetical protein